MLDLFVIFTRGGIVLWSLVDPAGHSTAGGDVRPPANEFISQTLLEGKDSALRGKGGYTWDTLSLHHRLDNELDLVFLAGHQTILKLNYVEALLEEVQKAFREKFGARLRNAYNSSTAAPGIDVDSFLLNQEFVFTRDYTAVLKRVEFQAENEKRVGKPMRSYHESSKKAAKESLVIDTSAVKKAQADGATSNKKKKTGDPGKKAPAPVNQVITPVHSDEEKGGLVSGGGVAVSSGDEEAMDVIALKREALRKKAGGAGKSVVKGATTNKAPPLPQKKGKQQRTWDASFGGGTKKDAAQLDYSAPAGNGSAGGGEEEQYAHAGAVGSMVGSLKPLEAGEEVEEEVDVAVNTTTKKSGGGMFSLFKGLVGNKTVNREMAAPVLEKLKEHMIAKNVAADIAEKLCESVAAQIDGKVLGTFESVTSAVRGSLQEALVQMLSPKRRVDILRDVIEAKRQGRPYVFTFCGVNGVGKSTNLAKICFWLIENNFRVLIAACDTFRAGAVEQLRTHTRALNNLHPPERHGGQQMVQLYEKGYGKDAAGIAMEAIHFARDMKIDVVLVDTAGRMQDNEPLMRALSKLIKVNEPDLVLFVGEALVGNEAVDQLSKFNQALADYSDSTDPHVIDGIVLTKFDAIDDKVGAAISMSYITGQPIMFVGTGQSYTDLRGLDAKSVIGTLMK